MNLSGNDDWTFPPPAGVGELGSDLVQVTGRPLAIVSASAPDCRAEVTHVSPYGVRAVVPPGSSWAPYAGEELLQVEVGVPGGSREFARATVVRCGGDGPSTVVEVVVEPSSTTGVLWALYDELRSGPSSFATRPPAGWRPPKIPARGHYTEAARLERLAWITEQTGADTRALRATSLDASALTSNVENFIAGVEVPVGLAGPLWFNGEQVQGLVSAPFATTEGSLVASATRGATAISRASGVTTRVVRQRMTRAPVFIFDDAASASSFVRWIRDHLELIRREVLSVSNWVNLVDIDPIEIGSQVHVRFLYETGDAAGQNMTTTCTWRACQWISARLDALGLPTGRLFIDANMSGDKKANYLSFIEGRGIRVIAECFIDRETLVEVLKATPEDMELVTSAIQASAFQIGSLGFDINVANTIAAIFTATGQDIACAHESSLAIFSLQRQGDGLYASMTLPALIVGTVGGGTGLPDQRTYLELLGCAGTGKVRRLAEIIAGFALALDLSTLAAIASGQFANSHEKLGRNRPVEWFTRSDLQPALLQPMLARSLGDESLTVTAIEDDESLLIGSSIVTDLTAQKAMRKFVGFAPLHVQVERTVAGRRVTDVIDLVVKSKPLGDEVALMLTQLASLCGGAVASEYARWQQYLGFNQTHRKELHLAVDSDPRLTRIMPRVYGVHRDPNREAYLLLSELLGDGFVLKDTADDVSGWQLHHLEAVVGDIASAHAVWLDRTDELLLTDWMGPVPSARLTSEMMPLWRALAAHAREEFPEWFNDRDMRDWHEVIDSIPIWWDELESLPRTLVHNDFSPRNICLRPGHDPAFELVVYDWELATVHVPQRDLAELLAFTLEAPIDAATVDHLVELHRVSLEAASGTSLDPVSWRRGYGLALLDFMVQRVSLYLMAHTLRDFRFLGRVLRTTRALMALERERSGVMYSGVDR